MLLLSRIMIKLSLIYFVTGSVLGAAILSYKAFPVFGNPWMVLSIHIELMIFGWIIQFTMGTAYWILPRFLRVEPRGNEKLTILMMVLFNAGIIFQILYHIGVFSFGGILGRGSQTIAVILFILLHWKRVITYRNH